MAKSEGVRLKDQNCQFETDGYIVGDATVWVNCGTDRNGFLFNGLCKASL